MSSQSFSREFRVFWTVWLIVFSTVRHTSSIWFTQRLGCRQTKLEDWRNWGTGLCSEKGQYECRSLTLLGLGMYMVGISKPHLFSPGRLHSSWTICIITLCGTNLKLALDVEQLLLYSTKPFQWVVPVCPTLRQPRRLCWGKNAVGRRVSRSGSPQCWGCVCTEPDPWGRRRPESGHRDLLRSPQQSNHLACDNSANCCRRASEVVISRYNLHSR